MKSFQYTIKDAVGIHARPAGQLVKLCKGFKSKVTITKLDRTVDLTQLMKLMGLGIKCGDTVTIAASGPDEEAALDAVRDFMEANL